MWLWGREVGGEGVEGRGGARFHRRRRYHERGEGPEQIGEERKEDLTGGWRGSGCVFSSYLS